MKNQTTSLQENTTKLEEGTINKNSFDELIKFHPCEDFPALAIVENNQGEKPEFYGVIGASKVTHTFHTKEEVLGAIKSTGVTNYPQLVAIVSGYLELIASDYFKEVQKNKENN